MNKLFDYIYQASSDFQLLPLSEEVIQTTHALQSLNGAGHYEWLLQPVKGDAKTSKLVCNNTAELLRHLKTPQKLPKSIIERLTSLPDYGVQLLSELILDGILVLNDQNSALSINSAYQFFSNQSIDSKNLNYLSKLSYAATRYGQYLLIKNPKHLAAQLYFYNRFPLTSFWRKKLPDTDAVRRYLRIDQENAALLDRSWYTRSTMVDTSWISWAHKQPLRREIKAYPYKLYISSTLEDLPETFSIVLDVFSQTGVSHFKIGKNLESLARPDKMVSYFQTFEDLHYTATQLMERLDHIGVHGVPFTAELFGNGLLSWGIDPVEKFELKGHRESWRGWLTNTLAKSILLAREEKDLEVKPWEFAINRLRLAGVDIQTWAPLTQFEQREEFVQRL